MKININNSNRRNSDKRCRACASYGSEWTVGVRHAALIVAFSGVMRKYVFGRYR